MKLNEIKQRQAGMFIINYNCVHNSYLQGTI